MPLTDSLRGLYAISDELLTPYEYLEQALENILRAGVKIFQLRDKSHSDEWLYPYARRMIEICERYDALFVLNDRLDLAIKLNAHALHLGKDDIAFQIAREKFKGILGASSYGDIKQAQVLQYMGADYVAFGACFPSSTKPHAPCITLDILETAKSNLAIPICAIGGITPYNISLLQVADMYAIINSLWSSMGLKLKGEEDLELWFEHIAKNIKNLQESISYKF